MRCLSLGRISPCCSTELPSSMWNYSSLQYQATAFGLMIRIPPGAANNKYWQKCGKNQNPVYCRLLLLTSSAFLRAGYSFKSIVTEVGSSSTRSRRSFLVVSMRRCRTRRLGLGFPIPCFMEATVSTWLSCLTSLKNCLLVLDLRNVPEHQSLPVPVLLHLRRINE